MKHRTLFLGTSLAAATLVGCMQDNASNGDAGADGGSLASCQSDYGASTAAQQLEAFSAAVSSFSSQAAELDTTLRTECRAIAIDLGAQPSEVMATATETETAVACRRAAELIRAETAAVRGAAGVTLTLQVRPPRCTVDVNAYSQCVASCDVTYQPGMAQITCEGGELRGTVQRVVHRELRRHRDGDVQRVVRGHLRGVVHGHLRGRVRRRVQRARRERELQRHVHRHVQRDVLRGVHGHLHGAVRDGGVGALRGRVPGHVQRRVHRGALHRARGAADGRRRLSRVVRHARERGRAVHPGAVVLRVDGTLEGALQTRADRLRATLEAHYGNIAGAGVRLRALTDAGVLVAQSSQRVPGAAVTLGVGAVACSASAAREFAASVPRVQVSLQASVSVSGAVTSG